MRRHHRDEVLVDVAGGLDLHRRHHLGHRGLVLGEERSFVGSAAEAGAPATSARMSSACCGNSFERRSSAMGLVLADD